MFAKILKLIFRNITRSRTRFMITTLGCVVAAFVICFFLAAENSLRRMTAKAKQDANLVISQKDRH